MNNVAGFDASAKHYFRQKVYDFPFEVEKDRRVSVVSMQFVAVIRDF